MLWVTLLFAAMLGVNRLFVAEQEQGGFDGFLLAPVDRTALLVAKASALFLYLVARRARRGARVRAAAARAPTRARRWLELIAVLALADVGIAVIGTLVAALAIQTRARELLVPLLALPLLVPLLIAAAHGTAPLFLDGGADPLPARWLGVLGLYDLVFALLAYAVFDFLLED